MIYIKINDNNEVAFQHLKPFDQVLGMNKTEEELLKDGILVESVPVPKQINGKLPILKYNGTSLYYEYQDAPIDEMTALKNKLVAQEQRIKDQEDALIEIATRLAEVTA